MRIREAQVSDSAAIARVRVESWRTTYRGLLPDEYLDGLSYERHARNWENIIASGGRQGFAYVVEDETGQVVGFALGGIDREDRPDYRGEIYAIYLLKEYQGRGLGRELMRAIARRLLDEGFDSMLVWVLEGNPACRFYEALGGEFLYTKPLHIAGGNYTELAYGWRDIRPIAGLDSG